MPFSSKVGFPFSETGVAGCAPRESGVYGIYNNATWIYVGEAQDIEGRLYEHLRGQSDQSRCILGYQPTRFLFEKLDAKNRTARETALIRELFPKCNPL